jgi:hypothetical protein
MTNKISKVFVTPGKVHGKVKKYKLVRSGHYSAAGSGLCLEAVSLIQLFVLVYKGYEDKCMNVCMINCYE